MRKREAGESSLVSEWTTTREDPTMLRRLDIKAGSILSPQKYWRTVITKEAKKQRSFVQCNKIHEIISLSINLGGRDQRGKSIDNKHVCSS